MDLFKYEIEKIEVIIQENLSKKLWLGSNDPVAYFDKQVQGTRYDDGLYKLIPPLLSKKVNTVLDVGAGEGKLAEVLSDNNFIVNCLEPSQRRLVKIKEKSLKYIDSSFNDLNSKKKYDCCISLRSIGVISKYKDQFLLYKTLQKLLSLSKIQLVIISKATEDYSDIAKDFVKLSMFQIQPWLYHFEILKLMQKSPKLTYISLDVVKKYKSIEDCISRDFNKDSITLAKGYLSTCSFENKEGFFRKVRLLFPVVTVIKDTH